jgi:hypothetical protein
MISVIFSIANNINNTILLTAGATVIIASIDRLNQSVDID